MKIHISLSNTEISVSSFSIKDGVVEEEEKETVEEEVVNSDDEDSGEFSLNTK